MDLEASFEHDLRRWLSLVYERLDGRRRHDAQQAAEVIIERQNRFFTVLVGILGASTLLLPFAEGGFTIGALVLLYGGVLVSSIFTALRIRTIDQIGGSRRTGLPRSDQAWNERPGFGPDERAQLIRIINLSSNGSRELTRQALARELSDAKTSPVLAGWPPLRDAEILLGEAPRPSVDAYERERSRLAAG